MNLRLIIAAILVLSFTASCTIQKRVHTGGYYIQWHKRHRNPTGHKEKPVLAEVPEKEEATEDTLTEPVEIVTEAAPEPTTQADSIIEAPNRDSIQEARKARPFEPLGVLSAKLLVPSAGILYIKDRAENKRQDLWLGFAFLAALLTSFGLGIVSMVRYLRNPKAYRFNIWAIIGILVPLMFFALLLTGGALLF